MFDLRLLLTLAQLAALLALLLRLFLSRLFREYRFFTAYILFELLRLCASLAIPSNTSLYSEFFFATESISWIFYVLVLMEVFQHALRSHPGIASFSRRVLFGSMIVAAVMSVSTLLISYETPSKFRILEQFLLIDRVILSSLLILIFLLTVFLRYFPVPLSRNSKVHATIFAAYFFFKTAVLLFRNLVGPQMVQQANIALFTLATLCLLGWARSLTRDGETIADTSAHRADPETERKLLAQLDAINSTLLKSAKK
jgi:hypothetical protein